ncbi:hypothetical protein HS088_TW11G00360 [Tripterygium wilfordii]|uniref:Uncharacterized protein n=1 Tax=Tripterygium wilfordii TaxID=458696 RepID=A0A7J7D1T9_TRIWF|nr:hypothetical protein HS088_TW11G00360 [Tripterygium wilfordii]
MQIHCPNSIAGQHFGVGKDQQWGAVAGFLDAIIFIRHFDSHSVRRDPRLQDKGRTQMLKQAQPVLMEKLVSEPAVENNKLQKVSAQLSLRFSGFMKISPHSGQGQMVLLSLVNPRTGSTTILHS